MSVVVSHGLRELYTKTAEVIEVTIYSDDAKTTADNLTGQTVKLLIDDPGGTTYSYTATITDAANGKATVTLIAANHQVEGPTTLMWQIDDVPKQTEYRRFVARLEV